MLIYESTAQALLLQVEMEEVGARKEVGSLVVEEGNQASIESNLAIELPRSSAIGPWESLKLSITENSIEVDSGLVLQPPSGKPVVIVAGAYPYSLAIKTDDWYGGFRPEYPLKEYRSSLV